MKALIIAAHGSRKAESNNEVASLARRVSDKAGDMFDSIDHAFLQFADPLLEEKVAELIEKGADQLVIFPFFIGSGAHILVDIPELVDQVCKAHPGVDIRVTRHLGKIKTIEDIIIREVGF